MEHVSPLISNESRVRFFFYGTLTDPEILRAVLRRSVNPAQRRKAVLHGYRRVYRLGACYPVLVAHPTGQVDGIVVSVLTTRDVALLSAYEGPDYELRELAVRLAGGRLVWANVFVPTSACEASSEIWKPEEWRRRFRQAFQNVYTAAPGGTHESDRPGGAISR